LAKTVVSVSNKLSIAAVLGLVALPVLPYDAASGVGARERPAMPPPIKVVQARPVPIPEATAGEPVIQLAARRSRVKREPPAEAEERAPQEAVSAPAAKPTRKTSSISQPESEKTPLPPAPELKSPEAVQTEPPKPDVWS